MFFLEPRHLFQPKNPFFKAQKLQKMVPSPNLQAETNQEKHIP